MNHYQETNKGKALISGKDFEKDELVEEYPYYTVLE